MVWGMNQPFNEWRRENQPGENMHWLAAALDQFEFLERLAMLIAHGGQDDDASGIVISTHRSKSITLPVVQWARHDLGVTFTIRDNFYNYKLSVSSDRPVDDPHFPALFMTEPPPDPGYTGNPLSPVYFEGFPAELIYGYQSQNGRRWSAEIHGQYQLHTVVFLCLRALGARPALTWSTR